MKLVILLLAFIYLNPFSKSQTNVSADPTLSGNGHPDYILTEEMVAHFPFIKPTMPMQKALRIDDGLLPPLTGVIVQ